MNKIIVLAISAMLWGCSTPKQSLSGDYEIVGVECEKSLQEKLTDICVGKYIYRSRADVPNLYKAHLMTSYAGNELKWFDTPSGFMPEKSDYILQAFYGMSQERGEIILFAPNHSRTVKFKVKYIGSHVGSNLLDISDVISLYYNDNYIFNEYQKVVKAKCIIRDFVSGWLQSERTDFYSLLVSVNLKDRGSRFDTQALEFRSYPASPQNRWIKMETPVIASKFANNRYSVSYTTIDERNSNHQIRYDFSFELLPDELPE